jgi:hypothetical protein
LLAEDGEPTLANITRRQMLQAQSAARRWVHKARPELCRKRPAATLLTLDLQVLALMATSGKDSPPEATPQTAREAEPN